MIRPPTAASAKSPIATSMGFSSPTESPASDRLQKFPKPATRRNFFAPAFEPTRSERLQVFDQVGHFRGRQPEVELGVVVVHDVLQGCRAAVVKVRRVCGDPA